MSHAETHTIVLAKYAQRQLQSKAIEGNITALLASVNNKSLAITGWTLHRDDLTTGSAWTKTIATDTDDAEYRYFIKLTAEYSRRDDKLPDTHALSSIARTLNVRVGQPAFGKWTVHSVDGKPYEVPDDDSVSSNINADLIGYSDVVIPTDWDANFAHLFGLESHITLIKEAIEAGIESDWRNRFHCALIGPPGCGKSDICESLRDALGEEAVMKFDATAMTAAGAIKELTEREILPRVIVVEESEKAPEAATTFLLGVLDLRAEIRKTTARGNIQRDTKLFAIATINDEAAFDKMQAGALSSRFMNKIHFRRPSRETLALILTREVSKVSGARTEWIDPTLDYCEKHNITDPRNVIAKCLCGKDKWLTGEYERMLDETSAKAAE